METATSAAARSRSDKTAPRGARRRLREPTRAPELLPAPVDERGRTLSADRVKWKLTRQLLQEGLTSSQIALALATVDFAPGGQVTTAAMRRIASRGGMGRSTAFRHRRDLVARGVLVTEPQHGEDGAQITSRHAIAREVFERAGIFFSSPPPSHFGTPPRPGSGHKRDPSSILDPLSGSGSVDPSRTGREHRARETARRPVVFSNDLDPAFADLARAHANAHAAQYRRAIEEAGQTYGPEHVGTVAHKHREPIALELRNLAARANEYARTRNRFDLTDDAIRLVLTKRIVRAFFAQQRPYLLSARHPIGCLWGRGGADGTPCDLVVLGARVFEEWCAALDDGPEPAPLVAPPLDAIEPSDEAPDTAAQDDEIDTIRAACEELRNRAAETPRAPSTTPEIDAIEPGDEAPDTAAPTPSAPAPEHVRRGAPRRVENDDDRAARERMRAVVEALAEQPSGAPPPRARVRACGLSEAVIKAREEQARQRAELARIGEMARLEARDKARAKRALHHRGGRAPLPTRPHPRGALLASLARLPGTSTGWATWSTTSATTAPLHEATTSRDDEQRRPPPLLRDVRPGPNERAPRRRRAPPRRRAPLRTPQRSPRSPLLRDVRPGPNERAPRRRRAPPRRRDGRPRPNERAPWRRRPLRRRR